MSRQARGHEYIEAAYAMIRDAKSAEDLRMAQAVILPLEYGLSIEQCSRVLGISRSWVAQLRGRFMAQIDGTRPPSKGRGGRQRAYLSPEAEVEFLRPFFDMVQNGGNLMVSSMHIALEMQLQQPVALSSVYRLLHRHGWRKTKVADKKQSQGKYGDVAIFIKPPPNSDSLL